MIDLIDASGAISRFADDVQVSVFEHNNLRAKISPTPALARSDVSLRAPPGMLPGESSSQPPHSPLDPPPPSAYNLLIEEGVAAYKQDRDGATLRGDNAYRTERRRQEIRKGHQSESKKPQSRDLSGGRRREWIQTAIFLMGRFRRRAKA